MGNKHTSTRHIARRNLHQIDALNLYVAGHTYERIAKELGYYDRSTAAKAVKRALQLRTAERNDLADQAITLNLERLDAIIRTHNAIALDHRHPQSARSADVVLRAIDRQIRLLGLDQPQRIEATVVQKDQLDVEIAAMAQQLKSAAAARGINTPTPSLDAVIGAAEVGDDQEGEK